MKHNELLTNEKLTAQLPNKFRLAQIAIDLARHQIAAGQDFTVTSLLDEMKKEPQSLTEMQQNKAS